MISLYCPLRWRIWLSRTEQASVRDTPELTPMDNLSVSEPYPASTTSPLNDRSPRPRPLSLQETMNPALPSARGLICSFHSSSPRLILRLILIHASRDYMCWKAKVKEQFSEERLPTSYQRSLIPSLKNILSALRSFVILCSGASKKACG